MSTDPNEFIPVHVSIVFQGLSKPQLLEIKNCILNGTEISDTDAKRAVNMLRTSVTSRDGLHEITRHAILNVIATRLVITQEELHERLSGMEDQYLMGIFLHIFGWNSKRKDVPSSDKISFLYIDEESEYLSKETANAFHLYCKNRLNL